MQCAALTAVAQVPRGGGGGAASAALMQQYQQAEGELAQLQADNAKLKKDLEASKKDLDAARQQLAAAKVGANRSQAALSAAQAAGESSARSLEEYRAKLQELIAHYTETARQLRTVETERGQLQQQLAESKRTYDQCVERNYDLYQVDNEVLDRYEHQGAFSYLARAEPFTRLERTRIENLVTEYRQRAEELRLQKSVPGKAPAANPPAASPPPASPPPTNPQPATPPGK